MNTYRVIYYTNNRWALYTIKSTTYEDAQDIAVEFMLTNHETHAIVIHDSFCDCLDVFPNPEEMMVH